MELGLIVFLCLFSVAIVYFLINRKPDVDTKSEKEPKSAPASSPYSTGSAGRHLECSEEELEQSFERLARVLSRADARKRDAPHERGASPQLRESSAKEPSQPRTSQSNIQEKPSRPKSHERDLVNEIEQAVQETVDVDVPVRRRPRQAPPASRSHGEVSGPELSEKL